MKTKNQTQYIAYTIVFLSLTLILGYVESLFPITIGDVGIKIGLSNIVTILGLKIIGTKRTILINILRLIILGILFGNMVRFTISVAGFIVSFIVMYLLLIHLKIGVIISSIFGGIFHNIGQFIAIILIMKNYYVLYLLPIYVLLGILSGLFVGIISNILIKSFIMTKGEL